MAKREIRNPLDRKNRNNHNSNYSELYKLKKTVNSLVLDSGESNAEVVQARAGEDTLNDRLDNMEDSTNDVSGDVSTLESKVEDKLDTMASLSDLDSYSQEISDDLEEKMKEMEETIDDVVGNIEFNGALVMLEENRSVPDKSWTYINFYKAVYNTAGFWSPNHKHEFVIPEGVTKVRVQASVLWESLGEGSRRIRVRKNDEYSNGLLYNGAVATGTSPLSGSSSVVEVQEGDRLALEVYQSSGETIDLRVDPYTWFAIEVVEYRKK